MNALAIGVVVALLVVGYPLYELVTTGQLDPTSAVFRGAVVAGLCAAGVSAIVRMALSWENATEQDRAERLNALFTDMEDAKEAGTLKDEDTPPPDPGTPGA
jgi:hypothetical protein